jgi:hypothetical protein
MGTPSHGMAVYDIHILGEMMPKPTRETVKKLEDLPNIGKAMARDLRLIGIHKPSDLIGRNPLDMYHFLCGVTKKRHDPCVLDVFMAAVHFMETGEALSWWAFTGERKKRFVI